MASYITAVVPVFVGAIDCTMAEYPAQLLSSGVQRMIDG
jgi:hypothetical protein